MIGVKKISHASYETPDLERQIEYYTNVLGLSLIARERDAVYLASTIEHHSVILRQGSHPRCTRIGFQLRKNGTRSSVRTPSASTLGPRMANAAASTVVTGTATIRPIEPTSVATISRTS